MTHVVFHVWDDSDHEIENRLRDQLNRSLPDVTLHRWPLDDNSISIDCAVVWGPPDEFFDNLQDLKAIFSVAAGVDHLLKHPGLPKNVPIVRLLDAGMGEKMAEYVLFGVMQAHRKMHDYRHLQSQQIWSEQLPSPDAGDLTVGILGLGTLGKQVAHKLLLNGYTVEGWTRSEKKSDSIKVWHGQSGLSNILARCDVLVCLLPLTQNTQGILNQSLFSQCRQGMYLINVARGEHLVDADLLASIESGQISGALLDVTAPEPLPAGHPFWAHPQIDVTPHISAPTQSTAAIEQIVTNLQLHLQGQPMSGVVDDGQGY